MKQVSPLRNKTRAEHHQTKGRTTDTLALALLALYILVFSFFTIREHNSFGTRALDLAKFDQAIWNTAHGRFFQITLSERSAIQSHFSPALALYSPLYWIWSDIRFLFIVQSALFGLAGYLIYVYFREERPWLGLSIFAAFLMNPTLHQVNLIEFRRLTLAVFTTSFALYHMLKKQYSWMMLGLVLTLLCKEDMAFTWMTAGLYVGLKQKTYKLGAVLAIAGLLYLLIIPFAVLPALNTGSGYHHAGANYAYLGSSLDEMISSLANDPLVVLRYVVKRERVTALLRFLSPSLFLFVLAPEVAGFMLPHLGFLLASSSDRMGTLEDWYPSVLIVFLYWAVGIGLTRLEARWRHRAMRLLPIAGVVGWLLFSPMWPGARFSPRNYQVVPHDRFIREALKDVPSQASVAAQDAMVPHLSQRRAIYLFPWISQEHPVDYVALDRSMGTYPQDLASYRERFYTLFTDPYYDILHQVDEFYLFKHTDRPAFERPRNDTWGERMTLVGYDAIIAADGSELTLTGTESRPHALRVDLYWRVEKGMSANYSVFVHVLDANQNVLAQHDSWVADGRRPTSSLEPGDFIRDAHSLTWKTQIGAEDTRLRIGLYDSVTREPLRLPNGEPYIVVPTEPE